MSETLWEYIERAYGRGDFDGSHKNGDGTFNTSYQMWPKGQGLGGARWSLIGGADDPLDVRPIAEVVRASDRRPTLPGGAFRVWSPAVKSGATPSPPLATDRVWIIGSRFWPDVAGTLNNFFALLTESPFETALFGFYKNNTAIWQPLVRLGLPSASGISVGVVPGDWIHMVQVVPAAARPAPMMVRAYFNFTPT